MTTLVTRSEKKLMFTIITGYGKSRGAEQRGDVRAAVFEMMKNFNLEPQTTANPGTFVLTLGKNDLQGLHRASAVFRG